MIVVLAYVLESGYMFVYAGALPLLVLGLWAVAFKAGGHKIHVTILGFAVSLILTSFITDLVKNSVGRPRPDLIARCKPRKGSPEHSLVTIEICTETDHHVLHDGWRSFPSGHSSFAFSGLGYLALYLFFPSFNDMNEFADIPRFLAGQMHVFRPGTDLGRVLLALAPLIGAGLIAISRCEDYRHDVYDVTAGSILGLLVAHISYRRYYPGLRSPQCDIPYPSRAETAGMKGFVKVRDEEQGIDCADHVNMEDMEDSAPLRPTEGDDGGTGIRSSNGQS
jgi:diacylglycerol diphosphate phosphatase/phosphatidate phosphatase